MSETGVVRRIDELGRVVIPKEIRRVLRIKEKDPLEIFTENDSIIFKSYRPQITLDLYASEQVASLRDSLGTPAMVGDLNEIVAIAGLPKKLAGAKLSEKIKAAMEKRDTVTVLEDTELIEGGEPFRKIALAPILTGTDFKGIISIVGEKDFSQESLKAIEVGARFLGKRMGH